MHKVPEAAPEPPPALPADPEAAARAARLRYVSDEMPGIERTRTKSGAFRYKTPQGTAVTDPKTLARINALGIPPAYEDVWICPIPNGHLQATGRDARGRKQYRYHARWREIRDGAKYDRMLAFGDALPRIRERVDHDLGLPGLPRDKVLATIVRLLEKTRIRVGNEEYAQANDSYGLTTLHNDHVDIERGGKLHFHFRGKSGKFHEIDLKDPRVAKVVGRLQEIEGQELFQWVERGAGADGEDVTHRVTSGDVNAYLHQIAGEEFTAKDFRTWAGTVLCALCLASGEAADSPTAIKHAITEAVKETAGKLGNTPAICRKCYVHPALFTSFADGTMAHDLPLDAAALKSIDPDARKGSSLTPEEKAVLDFLRAKRAAE